MKKLLFSIVLILIAATITSADEKYDNAAALTIIDQIIGTCETKGMLACQPNIMGADQVFDYIRLLDSVRETEAVFDKFIKRRYANEAYVRFFILDTLSPSIDITFTRDQFVKRITSVKRVANGYDVTMDGKHILGLRNEKTRWYVQYPDSMTGQLDQIKPFRLVSALKRSILVYRMLEAEMANLGRAELEKKVSEDIAPIAITLFGKEKFPQILKWFVKDANEVVAFYQPFKSVDDMKAHIRKTYKLSS